MVPISRSPPLRAPRAAASSNNVSHRKPVLISPTDNVLSEWPRRSKLYFDGDGPGELIPDGPRHDNDYTDFRNINILPTMDEVLSTSRPVYMPKKNVDEDHFLGHGLPRLLDTHFRHLRYDSTESLRDVCYAAMQQAFLDDHGGFDPDKPFQETLSGNRYQLYDNVHLEDLIASEKNGMLVNFSFDCPLSLHGPRIHKANRLQTGMLCALISMNTESRELSMIYFNIHLRQSTLSMEPHGQNGRAAVQLTFLDNPNHDEVLYITRSAFGFHRSTKRVLVEFPKVLLAGFYNPLRRLQQMSIDDIAFSDYLVPYRRSDDGTAHVPQLHIHPPQYTKDPDFVFDISSLTTQSSAHITLHDLVEGSASTTSKYLHEYTTLDEGQASALCNSLGREFAFTQGPPGTGKTYLGVALTRVLLASRSQQKKPIMVVCLTNHALDAFLAGLRDAGVENLLRIGSGSKEEWTKSINLRTKAMQTRLEVDDYKDLRETRAQKKQIFGELTSWCESRSRSVEFGYSNWHEIEPVLKNHYPEFYDQLVMASNNKEAQAFTFDYWAGGGDITHIGNLQKELSDRLLETTKSSSESERDLVEFLLRGIAMHAEDMRYKAGDDDIWRSSSAQRRNMISE